jgi:uncharacterized cofD-like protein
MEPATTHGRGTRIVGLGGGAGLSVLVRGLKEIAIGTHGARRPLEITAVVSMADDGGSTGRLRRGLGVPALGDLRNCLVAASSGDRVWRDLFQYRFASCDELGGHALGNLVMAALLERSGGLLPALDRLNRPLRLCARVLPVTEARVTLCARRDDGRVVSGESAVAAHGRRIEDAWLTPAWAAVTPGVREALAAADAIVLGPGSLFTSVVPNLLVRGVAGAIRASGALRIYVCNLMTQPGETEGLDVAGHLRVLERYLGPDAIDVCLINGRLPEPGDVARFLESGAEPVTIEGGRSALGRVLPVVADLVPDGAFANRHDPDKLARLVVSLARSLRRGAAVEKPAPPALPFPLPPPGGEIRWKEVS